MDTKKYYKILDGPSKDRIFDAFRYAHDKGVQITLDFEVALGYTSPGMGAFEALGRVIPMTIRDIHIDGIAHEGGGISDRLVIVGKCKADLEKYGRNANPTEHEFEAYYDTKKRNGTINIWNEDL